MIVNQAFAREAWPRQEPLGKRLPPHTGGFALAAELAPARVRQHVLIFAAIALALASLGLYAVMAHSVSQRVREIGVRMALGATAGDILGLVFKQGMWQLALGMLVGLSAAAGVTRVLRALLIGVTPADPLTFVGAALVLAIAGVLGCAIPAGSAMRVDPVVALRND